MKVIDRIAIGVLAMGIVQAGCSKEVAGGESAVGPRGRSLVKLAIGEGASCEGVCGAQAEAGCWCDDDCHGFGDCCSDKVALCGDAGLEQGTCRGSCGAQSQNGNCWCDAQCHDYNDCCRDKSLECGRPPAPPEGWDCVASFYGTHDGCDCECGVPDPDCDDPEAELYGCYGFADATCNAEGQCARATPVPEGWACDPMYYAAQDGCDCACGVYDPDCDSEGAWLYGCDGYAGASCSAEGLCVGVEIPEAWICEGGYYQAADGCDCACGAYDPDCVDPEALLYGCEGVAAPVCTAEGLCESTVTVPEGWTCDVGYFGAQDGCDCACGAYDPDCVDPEALIYGCEIDGDVCSPEGLCVSPV